MSSDGMKIGDRFKDYEAVSKFTLPRRIPVILRIDGRAFHTVTRKHFGKSWSMEFVAMMSGVARAVQKEIQGCDFCYCQSDEISFLLTDYKTIETEPWFKYNTQKMISISASIASVVFSKISGKDVSFDSRVFSVPKDDVVNYFIWRQFDAMRNAIQFAGRENYSQKQMHNKNCSDIQKMLLEKNIDFDKFPEIRKRGFCVLNGQVDFKIPVFTNDRDYIEKFVDVRED